MSAHRSRIQIKQSVLYGVYFDLHLSLSSEKIVFFISSRRPYLVKNSVLENIYEILDKSSNVCVKKLLEENIAWEEVQELMSESMLDVNKAIDTAVKDKTCSIHHDPIATGSIDKWSEAQSLFEYIPRQAQSLDDSDYTMVFPANIYSNCLSTSIH